MNPPLLSILGLISFQFQEESRKSVSWSYSTSAFCVTNHDLLLSTTSNYQLQTKSNKKAIMAITKLTDLPTLPTLITLPSLSSLPNPSLPTIFLGFVALVSSYILVSKLKKHSLTSTSTGLDLHRWQRSVQHHSPPACRFPWSKALWRLQHPLFLPGTVQQCHFQDEGTS